MPTIDPEPPPTICAASSLSTILSHDTRALYDTGADDNTTDNPFIIHNLRLLPRTMWSRLHDAGQREHVSKYGGECKIRDIKGHVLTRFMRFTPSMGITVVDQSKLRDPSRVCESEHLLLSHKTKSYSHVARYTTGDNDVIPLICFHRKQPQLERYYTQPFLPVSIGDAARYVAPNGPLYRSNIDIRKTLHHLSRQIQVRSRLPVDAERALWHARLVHISDDALCLLHKKTKGVPPIRPRTAIDPCPTCISTKLKKKPKFKSDKIRDHASIRDDPKTVFFQHLQLDFGFIVVRSKNEARYKRLSAYNGDTCYLTVQCMKTNYVMGVTAPSKEAPMKFLHYLLVKFCPWHKKDRSVRMDEGGETGRNPGVVWLFQEFQYHLQGTGPDNSSAIGQEERFHPTVKGGIRSMIEAVDWTWKVWNLAFYHYIRIWNWVPHGPQKLIPYTVITQRMPILSLMRIFGCPLVVLEKGKRPALEDHTRRGRFCGHGGTMKKFLYLPHRKTEPLSAVHVAFDELFSTFKRLPPIALYLRRSLGMDVTTLERQSRRVVDATKTMDVLDDHEQFARIAVYPLSPEPTSVLGLEFGTDSTSNRGYISNVLLRSLVATSVKKWRTCLIGAYVIRVGDVIVVSVPQIQAAFKTAMELGEDFEFTVARDALDPIPRGTIAQTIPQLQLDQLRSIATIRASIDDNVAGEDVLIGAVQARSSFDPADAVNYRSLNIPESEIKSVPFDVCLEEPFDDVECLDAISELDVDTESITVVEAYMKHRGLDLIKKTILAATASVKDLTSKNSQFSRRHLKTLPNWDEWKSAEWKMLDQMLADNMFGDIVRRADLEGIEYDIIRIVWSYVEKLLTGKKKARVCGNGNPLKAVKKFFQKTYAACASMVGMRLLFAIAAYENRIVYDLDATNAFAQSGLLDKRTFLVVDEAFREWYYARFSILLDIGSLVELLSSIQGHPHAGPNWNDKVSADMKSLSWASTTHEPCLYRRQLPDMDHDQLMCRQIDDIIVAVKGGQEEFRDVVQEFRTKFNLESEYTPVTAYNGLQIEQTEHYIAIYIEKYILSLVKSLGWMEDKKDKDTSGLKQPLSETLVKEILQHGKGAKAGSPEAIKLQTEMGFGYRNLLGALIFACVICRLDISYSMSLLSRFSEYPAECCYRGLKSVTRYLRATAKRPIIYWRKEPLLGMGLPVGDFEKLTLPDECTLYPYPEDPYRISADVDSSLANDVLTRRSTGGHIVFAFAAAVYFVAKLQKTVATSSTQSEFMQAVLAGKSVKFIRHVMTELHRYQHGPSPMNEDNAACIMMINQNRPTDRTKHLEVQWFAIQQWREDGDIVMFYIDTKDNSADAMTKALGWVLHNRHAARAMGLYGSPYAQGKGRLPRFRLLRDETV